MQLRRVTGMMQLKEVTGEEEELLTVQKSEMVRVVDEGERMKLERKEMERQTNFSLLRHCHSDEIYCLSSFTINC